MAAVAICVLAALAYWLREKAAGFDWGLFGASFRRMHPAWLAASVGLVFLTYAGRVIRWRVMLAPLQPRSSFWGVFSATCIGFTAVVLFGRAGELVRPYLIAVKEKVPFSSQMAAWLLERIYDLLVVLIIFGFALTRFPESAATGPGLRWAFQAGGHVVGGVCTVCLALLILFSRFPEWVEKRLGDSLGFLPAHYGDRVRALVASFLEGTKSTRSAVAVGKLVLYTVLEWLLIAACVLCLFQAVPATARLGLVDGLVLLGFLALGSVVQLPGIGGGMQVVTIAVLTELYGVPLEIASGAAIMLWIITFVTVTPFGLLLAFREGLSWRAMRHIRNETL